MPDTFSLTNPAAVEAVRRWPHNGHLAKVHDPITDLPTSVQIRMFEWYAENGSDDGLDAETLTMAWPADGTFYECPPLMPVGQIAQQSAPWDALECDRCRNRGDDEDDKLYVQSVVLVPFRFYLIGMVLCTRCTYEMSRDERTHLIMNTKGKRQ